MSEPPPELPRITTVVDAGLLAQPPHAGADVDERVLEEEVGLVAAVAGVPAEEPDAPLGQQLGEVVLGEVDVVVGGDAGHRRSGARRPVVQALARVRPVPGAGAGRGREGHPVPFDGRHAAVTVGERSGARLASMVRRVPSASCCGACSLVAARLRRAARRRAASRAEHDEHDDARPPRSTTDHDARTTTPTTAATTTTRAAGAGRRHHHPTARRHRSPRSPRCCPSPRRSRR